VSRSRQVDPRARRPAPPPKEADDRLVTSVLTAGWALALAVLLVVRSALPDGARWWLWTCTAGLAMGLFALWYVPFLKRRRAVIAARYAPSAAPEPAGAAEAAGAAEPESVVPEPGYSSRDSGSNTVSSTETPGSSTRS
jgi:Protein of unknown function (DUF2530)